MAKATIAEIRKAILKELPKDGGALGNQSLRERIAERLGAKVTEEDYFEARDALVDEGKLARGRGRGGSVSRVAEDAPAPELTLATQEIPETAKVPAKSKQPSLGLYPKSKPGEPTRGRRQPPPEEKVIAYRHDQTRTNNPEVGLVTPDDDADERQTRYAWDPHIDPALQFDIGRAQVERLIDDALASGDAEAIRAALLQLKRQAEPYLAWTGKAERTSFEVDTVSLHVHERIDPSTLLAALRKRLKGHKVGEDPVAWQDDFFRAWFDRPLPLREAIEFYKHDRGWANRLIAGDSLLVMNSLLQKEGMAGQVQMIYIDPPYGIKYGSNFQAFVNKRDVKDRRDEDLTQEPEMIKAFRDTWELGIHSYLTYLRDRLLLAKELLHESGSVFVQISDENLHHVREILDEIFGGENFCSVITFRKTSSANSPEAKVNVLGAVADYLVWYAKDRQRVKYRQPYLEKAAGGEGSGQYTWHEGIDGNARALKRDELASIEKDEQSALRLLRPDNLASAGHSDALTEKFPYAGNTFEPPANSHWKTTTEGLRRLGKASRIIPIGQRAYYKRFIGDFPVFPMNNVWLDTGSSGFADPRIYVVQTVTRAIERCLLMTTDPGDLALDPTCGSGTTAYVAERWGRRWITCDTSRVAITLAKQRLMTASYDYYDLKYPHEGLRAGFIYKTVPHVTLKSIANNPEIDEIHERMHPAIEQALAHLNATLKSCATPFTVSEGGRKGKALHLDRRDTLLEWEVPFDFPADWPLAARAAFDAFHAARQTMQRRMDESIAAHADQETLYDQPRVAKDKLRISGPFTVEAVPFPTVLALDESQSPPEADASIARSGESARQHAWRDELAKTGIRGRGGQMLKIASLETLPTGVAAGGEGGAIALRYLHCTGTLDTGERVVVSFGPEYAALEQRQVELAMREAGDLFPRPKMIVFCAFTFDPEAAKDIDATRGIVALKAQMNTDLLTEDLKKARSSNQSFWLMGQPDVEVRTLKDGRYQVEVNGFDYFDTTKGELVSGGKGKIAAWALDTDYDERSLFPRQVFFPMAGAKDGWNKLRRDIKAELDESLLDRLHGTVSLPFEAGDNRKIAVKIVDDRGIESLKILSLD